MAQTGFTPIQIYSSSTVAAAPVAGSLTNSTLGSELAINITDGKLFYKDNANAVQVIAWKTTPTTAGGTGLTSYTAGDLLFYASGTALSKLAIGASGQYLSSSGTAPQWNAPAALTKTDDTNVTLTLGGSASTALLNAASLTLGWTGTLAVSRGGTGTGTAFTAGSVVFAGASGVYNQNNANFFWDNSNIRLGIGTATPATPITVYRGSAANTYIRTQNTAADVDFGVDGGGTGIMWNNANKPLAFGTNGVQRWTIAAAGDLTVETGNLIIGTSGKGIDFSATPGTGTSELLADYEEGTWTPSDTSGAGLSLTITGTSTYTKIGRQVIVNADITYPVTVDASLTQIGGLPFTTAAAPNGAGSIGFTDYGTWITIAPNAAGTGFRFVGAGGFLTNANLSGKRIQICIAYTV